MPSFFFSYSASERAFAEQLVEKLREAGISIWCDFLPGALATGRPWIDQLEIALESASGYLVLVGEAGIHRWVRAELDFALQRQVDRPQFRIVPLLMPGVDPAELPPFLQRFQAVRLPEQRQLQVSDSEAFQTLAEDLLHVTEAVPPFRGHCPFPGLECFDEETSHFFFGRQREVRDLVQLLGRTRAGYRRWLQIEGASGSGKSSLARAGMIPAVRRGWLEDAPKAWRVVVFRPGRHPLRSLAQAWCTFLRKSGEEIGLRDIELRLRDDSESLLYLARELTPPETGFLLVVDQLEELFTLGAANDQATETSLVGQFDLLLANALDDSDGPLYLVTTLRSDFLAQLHRLPQLEARINHLASRYYLSAMNREALLESLQKPLVLTGLEWESSELSESIVSDAGVSSGNLPLVAHVLRALWEKDHLGGVLTHATYDRLGGVAGALTRSADELLESLGAAARTLSRTIFLALVKVGRNTEDTRRVLTPADVLAIGATSEESEAVLARLSGGRDPNAPASAPAPPRLITSDADRVEVVHEELLRSWQTLRSWIEEDREKLERRDDLEDAARAWHTAGRPDGGLPRGGQLAYFEGADVVSAMAREYLDRARQLERRAQRTRRFGRRRVLAITGSGLVVVLVLAIALVLKWDTIGSLIMTPSFIAAETAIAQRKADVAFGQLRFAESGLGILLGDEPESDPHRLAFTRLHLGFGAAFEISQQRDKAREHFELARALALEVDSRSVQRNNYLSHAILMMGRLCFEDRNIACIRDAADESLQLIDPLDLSKLAMADLWRNLFLYHLQMLDFLTQNDHFSQVPEAFDSAWQIERKLATLGESTVREKEALVSALINFGGAGLSQARYLEIYELAPRVLQVADELIEVEPLKVLHRQSRIEVLNLIGFAALNLNRPSEARSWFEKTVMDSDSIEIVANPRTRQARYRALQQLGQMSRIERSFAQAEEYLEAAIHEIQSFENHQINPRLLIDEHHTYRMLSILAEEQGELAKAIDRSRSALDIADHLLKHQPFTTDLASFALVAQDRLYRFYRQAGDEVKAAEILANAHQVYHRVTDKVRLRQDLRLSELLDEITSASVPP